MTATVLSLADVTLHENNNVVTVSQSQSVSLLKRAPSSLKVKKIYKILIGSSKMS